MISLSANKEADLLAEIKSEAVDRYFNVLMERFGENLLSQIQAAAYLNVTTATLRNLKVPHVDVTGNGGTIGYELQDLKDYKERNKVNAKAEL